jgi:hypothetical protein
MGVAVYQGRDEGDTRQRPRQAWVRQIMVGMQEVREKSKAQLNTGGVATDNERCHQGGTPASSRCVSAADA